MSLTVLFPDTDKADHLIFAPPRRLNSGALRVDIKYKKDFEQEPIYQTCRFRRAFIKEWKDEKTGNCSLKLGCSLSGYDNPYSEVHAFLNGWKEVEATVVTTAKLRAKDWFKVSFHSLKCAASAPGRGGVIGARVGRRGRRQRGRRARDGVAPREVERAGHGVGERVGGEPEDGPGANVSDRDDDRVAQGVDGGQGARGRRAFPIGRQLHRAGRLRLKGPRSERVLGERRPHDDDAPRASIGRDLGGGHGGLLDLDAAAFDARAPGAAEEDEESSEERERPSGNGDNETLRKGNPAHRHC